MELKLLVHELAHAYHLGTVARGGLRWSDRRDDFRTEVLGLVKAQMVKNALIVPTGAKGGSTRALTRATAADAYGGATRHGRSKVTGRSPAQGARLHPEGRVPRGYAHSAATDRQTECCGRG